MKQKEVFKKIGDIIQELSDQYEYLQTVTGDLNDLELELFVSNAHFLTDHIEILCKLNLQNIRAKRPAVEKPENPYQQKFFEPVVQQMKHGADARELRFPKPPVKPVEPEIINDLPLEDQPVPQIDIAGESPKDSYSFIREEPEIIRHEFVLNEAEYSDDEETVPVEIEKPKEVENTKDETLSTVEGSAPVKELISTEEKLADSLAIEAEEKVTEADEPESKIEEKTADVEPEAKKEEKAADEVLTINQKISTQFGDKSSKTEQVSIKPISDIKLAITLNDKLLYVKDLFNGYNLAYSEAIEILNRFNTFDEAMRFLRTNYITKNNWEGKPATTEKFYALLKRRYA